MSSFNTRFVFVIYEMHKGVNPFDWPDVFYMIYQMEENSNGRPHLQGYVEFKSEKSFSELKQLHPTAYWGRARTSRENNYNYCTKLVGRLQPPVIVVDRE
jgi:hypothetical protein